MISNNSNAHRTCLAAKSIMSQQEILAVIVFHAWIDVEKLEIRSWTIKKLFTEGGGKES